ncbi:MAG TPA: DUF58 domain-containing protein [Gemmataceae bacterium]|nr:DUF58 domain-containing protein [Gemmataceae bacterium]
MLTTRGWWFLIVSLLVLALGLFAELAPLVPVGLALVLWVAGVGLLFYARARFAVRGLRVHRLVTDDRGPVETLWAGRPFEVHVGLRLGGLLSLPHVAVADRVPFAAVLLDGTTETAGPVVRDQPLAMSYRIRPTAPGRVRFEGLRLRLADLQGLFYFETFVPAVVEYRVLPVLADAGGRPAAHKRHNLLPPPGIHRLRRPGSGSELLDLRDYLPGDPPKTIAWKVSARRDRLVTKEFESEVPIRCTLFVDTSNSVRVGAAGRNALSRLVEIAAAVAQVNTGSRDLTGLCLFDDRQVNIVRPARTPRHLVQVLHRLADAAGLVPSTGKVRVGELLPLAYAFAEEVYPQLLRPDVNHVPFWLRWFGTRPVWLARRPGLGDRLHAALLGWALGYGLGCVVAVVLAAVLGGAWLLSSRPIRGDLFLWALLVAGGLGFLAVASFLAFLGWQVFRPRRRRGEARRKKLAALLSVRYGLAPGGLEALLEDDELMALHLQRFLAEHQVPYRLPFYDWHGRYLFAAPEKVDVLARALLQAVGKGHDNELFVLLADLIELTDRLEPLLRAVRVALARHHQLMIVCPWPPGLPPPTGAAVSAAAPPPTESGVLPVLRRNTAERFQRAFAGLRQTFARLGVPVLCAANEESVGLILDRMDRLRLMGRRR